MATPAFLIFVNLIILKKNHFMIFLSKISSIENFSTSGELLGRLNNIVFFGIVALLSACGGVTEPAGIQRPSPEQNSLPKPVVNPESQEPVYRADAVIDVGAGTWVILGSSTAAGIGAPIGKGWVSMTAARFAAAGANFINLARGSTVTYNGLSAGRTIPAGRPPSDPAINIDMALSYRPRVVILAYPTSDTLMGYSVDETLKNLMDMRSMALESGAQVIVVSTQPRNLDVEKREALLKINSELKNFVSKCFVNVYTPLADNEGKLKSSYDSGDGVHPNMEGHIIISTMIQELVDSNNCIRLQK